MTNNREHITGSVLHLLNSVPDTLACSISDAPIDLDTYRLSTGSYTPTQIWNDREIWVAQEQLAKEIWESFTPEYKEALVESARVQLNVFLDTVGLVPELDVSDLVIKSGNFLKVEVRLSKEHAFYFLIMFTDVDPELIKKGTEARRAKMRELGLSHAGDAE